MALSRNRRDSSLIWPGFVDAVTTLLMVVIFLLTIFTVMQSVLRDQISHRDSQLDVLNDQISALSEALGLERHRSGEFRQQVGELQAALSDALAREQESERTIASLRDEVSAEAETARLAAARAEALGALIADLEADNAEKAKALDATEAARLVDAAALARLREKFADADTERAAMTLALEEERRRAEETLTLLAAARDAAMNAEEMTTQKDAALAIAQKRLTAKESEMLESARAVELLNRQLAAARRELAALQGVLGEVEAKHEKAEITIEELKGNLNTALARVAAEQRKRAEMEAAEKQRLEQEVADLEKYRSEFFGQLSQVFAGREGVKVVGDRFVFPSEVLFGSGSADLSTDGKAQIARVAEILDEFRARIPAGINWIIRVDGHTDDVPLVDTAIYRDNWELSQARALSVVRYMQDELNFPPERLAAAGFGQYQPIVQGDDAAARAQNRRIELKLTER